MNMGGALQLFDKNIDNAIQTIFPRFNVAVIFSTNSYSYHGNPDPIKSPEDRPRRSLAYYYYYSTGRPEGEILTEKHSTLFKERKGEKFEHKFTVKGFLRDFIPPIVLKTFKSLVKK